MNASRIDSRCTASSAGSVSGASTRPSGIGCSHTDSGSTSPNGPSPVPSVPISIGRARRLRPSSMSRQTFVAIRYSHDRSEERPSNRSKLRQARTIVSCTASSASNDEPSIR